VGKRTRAAVIGICLALLAVGLLPVAAMAKQESMHAFGTIDYISGTVGFPAGESGNYKVMSRTVEGAFISGDLTGGYSMTYRANVDLNTQAGNMRGQLTTGTYTIDVSGTSYPVQWSPSADSPVGYVGTSSASGIWQLHGGPGSGTFSTTFSFVPTTDGHIDNILSGSTFELDGQWNVN
jgi:hypothetical protein